MGTLGRTALRVVLTATAEALALAALALALEIKMPPVNAALLLAAVQVLGGVWALRALLTGGRHAALRAALVPPVATALFLLPRFWLGTADAPLLTLGVVLLGAVPVERAWAREQPDDAEAGPAALAAFAPLAGLGLVCASVVGAWFAAAPVALALGLAAFAFRRARRNDREAGTYADFLDRIEVRPDGLIRPVVPLLRDPSLRALDAELAARATQLEADARSDARARDQISDARELRTRFMAAMSHELRSPLNSIVGFAQILEHGMEGELTEGQRESVTMVRRSAEELITLLTDILDLARLEAGLLELRRVWTPSVEILTEAVTRAKTLVQGQEVEIVAELQPGLPPVHVDQRRIVQAVVALFRHSASALSNTRIRLRARVAYGPPGPERHLRVEIHDALGAIPPEEVERIFEAFQEITEPAGRRVGGLGMALSLARGLVRSHGGEAWADSFPGAGTILCVAIPLDAGGTEP
ncbi:MAG: histidine kinase dimerization/phospho-acceptor domain-containing protein [Sandaracinaceae bacterium]